MKRRATHVAFVVSLFAALSGCETGQRLYYSMTHRIVRVPTENMLPTIKPGDRAAVDENYYSTNPVRRFDMVTFKLPPEDLVNTQDVNKDTQFLKRVIGLGGETVEIKGGRVYVNGQALEEPFATIPPEAREKFGPVNIPEGEFFLMGDNRANSWDSRYWPKPTLKRQYIVGKVVRIFPQ
ncbi:MAG: signal peptidase I [Acidobacteriota bacterium]|nr:signal peptidase I [Acidobacteriota bacterium]